MLLQPMQMMTDDDDGNNDEYHNDDHSDETCKLAYTVVIVQKTNQNTTMLS